MSQSRWRSLIAVADTGSVRGAAAALFVTESAVSAAVTALARDVGVPLVEKSGRGIRLTAAGLRYVDYLRTICGLLEEAGAAALAESRPGHGLLRIAAVTTVGDRHVPQLLQRFRAGHPEIEMRLEVGPSAHIWQLFHDHAADLVIGGRPPAGSMAVRRASKANDLVVVGTPELIANFEPSRTTWLLREPGSGTRATSEALVSDLALTGPAMTLGSNGAVVAGAIAGLGVTLVARDSVEAELASGALSALPLPELPLARQWYATTRPEPPGVAELFVRFLHSPEGAAMGWHPHQTPR